MIALRSRPLRATVPGTLEPKVYTGSNSPVRTCGRCGARKTTRNGDGRPQGPYFCGDCKSVDPEYFERIGHGT